MSENGTVNVKDYGMFGDGVSAINSLNGELDESKSSISQTKSTLDNDSVFMGPICDSCMDALNAALEIQPLI